MQNTVLLLLCYVCTNLTYLGTPDCYVQYLQKFHETETQPAELQSQIISKQTSEQYSKLTNLRLSW